MIFLISLLVNGATNVFAAYPTTKAPATLHVPYGLSFGPGIARNKILDGARAKGGEDAYREALYALDVEKSLIIKGDLSTGDNSYITFDGPNVVGENAIEQQIQKWSEEKKAAQPQKPQEQQKDKGSDLECLFVRPGQFDEQNESIPQGGGNITVKANMAGYGRSAEFAEPEFGDPESPTNMAIRTDQVPNTMLREIVQKDIAGAQSKIATASNKKITMFVPSATQAQEFVGTSNSGGIGTYKVGNGVSITPSSYNVGVRYPVNPDGTPAIASQKTLVFNKDCEPSVEDAPTNSVDQASNPGSNFGGAPGPGGLGGLESIFPLLMQMMGGGRGQQGGQNPNGSQYPPYNQLNQQQQQQNCAGLVSSPVCGLDKKTYRTACDARNARTSIVGQGECKQPTPTPNIAAISSMIVNQLNASGVPAAILEQVRNTVTSVLGGVLNGGAGTSQTIIK